MEYLLKIYEKNNLTEAAKDLFISPQALSKVIHQIENEYEEEIIIRNGNRFTFSQFGQSLVLECEKMLYSFSSFNKNVESYKKIAKQNIYLDMPINSALMFGYKNLNKFKKEYPEYNLIISEYDDYQIDRRALSDQSDVALVVDEIPSSELFVIRELNTFHFGIYISDAHPLANQETVTISDISKYPIVSRNEDYKIFFKLEKFAKLNNVALNYSLRTSDGLATKPMISDNKTICIVLDTIKDEGNYKFIPFKENIDWKLSIVCKKDKFQEEKIQKFYQFFTNNK